MNSKTKYAAIAITFMVMLTAWTLPAYADNNGTSIVFDLNGGTLDGDGTFTRTSEELTDGLPGVEGAVMPAGVDEFVVWSASLSNYEQLYNIGDPVPDVSTLYAVWGTKLDGTTTMSIQGTGCYIVEGSSGRTIDITSGNANGSLIVLRNVNFMNISINKDTTFLIQGTNIDNGLTGWGNYRLEFSSASTGQISFNTDLYSEGPLIIRGNVTVNGTINGGSILIDGNVNATHVYSTGPVTVKGNVSVEIQIMGSDVNLGGSVSVGNVYTVGDITIDGTVIVDTIIQGNDINVTGTLITDSIHTGGSLIVNDYAVVEVGDVEYPQPGKEYVEFVHSNINVEGVTDILVKFRIDDGDEITNVSVMLPSFDKRIFLGEGSEIVQENGQLKMDVYFKKDGKEWHSEGVVAYTSGSPGYYTCTLGVPSEVDESDEEPELFFVSEPPVMTTIEICVPLIEGATVKLIFEDRSILDVEITDNNATIRICDTSNVSGFWNRMGMQPSDEGTDNEFTIIDGDTHSCGTFILFIIKGKTIHPVCVMIFPEVGFDSVPPSNST